MIAVIEYIGLFLWVIYLFLFVKREISRKNKYAKNYTLQLIVKDPFHIIRIDSLFFFLVYLVYSNLTDHRILPYLYIIIILTNIVYVIYDISDNYRQEKISIKKEFIYYLIAIIFVILVITYAFISDILSVCIFTLGLNLLVPLYVWLIKSLKSKY